MWKYTTWRGQDQSNAIQLIIKLLSKKLGLENILKKCFLLEDYFVSYPEETEAITWVPLM